MSGGIQGIDTKGIEKKLDKSGKKYAIITICAAFAIGIAILFLQDVFFNDPIVIERTIDTKELQLQGPEIPSTSVEIPKTDDGDPINPVDSIPFNEKVVTQKVAEKIIQSP